MNRYYNPEGSLDIENPDLGTRIEVSACGTKIWVCVDGQCVLRVRGNKVIELDASHQGIGGLIAPKDML